MSLTALVDHSNDHGLNETIPFETTVPRHLVAQREDSEVLLTQARTTGPTTFIVGAMWSPIHTFYHRDINGYDSLLASETIRQATLLIGYHFLKIPLKNRLLIDAASVQKIAKCPAPSLEPTKITVNVAVSQIRQHKSDVVGFRTDITFTINGGAPFISGWGEVRTLTPQLYSRMRGNVVNIYTNTEQRPLLEQVPPPDLATDSLPQWLFSPLRAHPFFHVCGRVVDHISGMLLIEAARHAARLYTGNPNADFLHYTVHYKDFLNMNQPTYVKLDHVSFPRPNIARLSFSITQDDKKTLIVGEVATTPESPQPTAQEWQMLLQNQ